MSPVTTGWEHMHNRAIELTGCRVHNLKNVSLSIPRHKLVVVTGVSGSGKSSLAFDTLFAEGQRRYLETLTLRERKRLPATARPDIDTIRGLPPTLALSQKARVAGRRATVASLTDIGDFLRVLFTKAGLVHCAKCRIPVESTTRDEITAEILSLPPKSRIMVLANLVTNQTANHQPLIEQIARDGFVRVRVNREILAVEQIGRLPTEQPQTIDVVVDRLVASPGMEDRLGESLGVALRLGNGECILAVEHQGTWHERRRSTVLKCAQCQATFPDLDVRHFSASQALGACPRCAGLGSITEEQSVAPVVAKPGPKRRGRSTELAASTTYDQASRHTCPDCDGAKLSLFSRSVTFCGQTLPELLAHSVQESRQFWDSLCKSADQTAPAPLSVAASSNRHTEKSIAIARLIPELQKRLVLLEELGLGYLHLARNARSLSGGEFQRTRLAHLLSGSLIGVCYLLDEPTSGLHTRDVQTLVAILRRLQAKGNTVIVVEHDPTVIGAADWIVETGPGAGTSGGHLLYCGPASELHACAESVMAPYLSGPRTSTEPAFSPWSKSAIKTDSLVGNNIQLTGAKLHNLKGDALSVPIGQLTAVTGVSGSGKTSLVFGCLGALLSQRVSSTQKRDSAGPDLAALLLGTLTTDRPITRLIRVDSRQLGHSRRSTPASYTGLWNEIRPLFAKMRESRLRGFGANRFSLQLPSGRCSACQGTGQFQWTDELAAGTSATCPDCNGFRFNAGTLSVRYRGYHAGEILQMTVEEALAVFAEIPRIAHILQILNDVGLGYIQLGQPGDSLSGGEIQRIQLATELSKADSFGESMILLDEPTKGLHPRDVEVLLQLLRRLVNAGQTIVMTEHNLRAIAASDWMVEMGPGAGNAGGAVLGMGCPQEFAVAQRGPTGLALHSAFFDGPAAARA